MWLIGILSLMILVGGISGFLSRKQSSSTFATDFDLESISMAYARITAPLAAFSVAAAIFLANLARTTQTSYFVDVMASYLIAFIMLVATAIFYATFQSAKMLSLPEDHRKVHCMLFITCNLAFYISISVSWLGLRPLLLSIGLSSLASVFTWILLFTVLAGAIRLGAWLHTLLGLRLLASMLVTIFPIIAAIIYGLTLAPLSNILWPKTNPVLSLVVLVFAVGAIGGGVETSMITFYGQSKFHHILLRMGDKLIVPYISAAITAIALLWFSIASA